MKQDLKQDMNICTVRSAKLDGLTSRLVEVSCAVGGDFVGPRLLVSGISDVANRECELRLGMVLKALGRELPRCRIWIQEPVRTGNPHASLHLAMTIAILGAERRVPTGALEGLLVVGELGLDGSIHPARGVLPAALRAHDAGYRGVITADACAWEAAIVEGLAVHGFADLAALLAALRIGELPVWRRPEDPAAPAGTAAPARQRDMSELTGMRAAVEEVIGAVAERRNALLVGPPGTALTRLAQRIPTILPTPTRDEMIEITATCSAMGLTWVVRDLVRDRPFRAPHYSVSSAGLAAEAQLAARGVLYLDQLTEFRRASIEMLAHEMVSMEPERQPLIVASAQPCPCGWLGSDVRQCACRPDAIQRHRELTAVLSAMLDMGAVTFVRAAEGGAAPATSAEIRRRLYASDPSADPDLPADPNAASNPDAASDEGTS